MRIYLKLLHLIWVVPLLAILAFLVVAYYNSNYNDNISAKPQAAELSAFIKESEGEVLHTYNRSVGGGTVRSPSYEYYIDYGDTQIENRAKELSSYLRGLGYDAKYKKYKYIMSEQLCTKYGYGTIGYSPDGQYLKNETEVGNYCEKKTGISDPKFYGSTKNDDLPYYTVYGENGDRAVFAQITNKTFRITSNDFWGHEYTKKYNVDDEVVRPGHSMITVEFSRVN